MSKKKKGCDARETQTWRVARRWKTLVRPARRKGPKSGNKQYTCRGRWGRGAHFACGREGATTSGLGVRQPWKTFSAATKIPRPRPDAALFRVTSADKGGWQACAPLFEAVFTGRFPDAIGGGLGAGGHVRAGRGPGASTWRVTCRGAAPTVAADERVVVVVAADVGLERGVGERGRRAVAVAHGGHARAGHRVAAAPRASRPSTLDQSKCGA